MKHTFDNTDTFLEVQHYAEIMPASLEVVEHKPEHKQ